MSNANPEAHRDYELDQRRWWASKDNETDMSVHLNIVGKIPLDELLAYLARQGSDLTTVTVSGALRWIEPATEEEAEARREHRRLADERHEEWERGMWRKLRVKYGDGNAATDRG